MPFRGLNVAAKKAAQERLRARNRARQQQARAFRETIPAGGQLSALVTTLGTEASLNSIFAKFQITPNDVMDSILIAFPDLTADPMLKDLVDCWRGLSAYKRRTTTFDFLCFKSGCPADKLYATVCRFLYLRGFNEAQILIALNIPAVIRTMLNSVLTLSELGQTERMELLRALGVMTVGKNTQPATVVNVNAIATAAAAARDATPRFEEDMDDGEGDWSRPAPALPAANGVIIDMPQMEPRIESPVTMGEE